MSNVKTAISILWCLITVVIGSYYFVLTNDVQNLEKELAQINNDIKNDIRDIHILEADWSELNNPERLRELAGKYISHKRLLLQTVVKTSQNTKIFTAFNDVVLHSANLRTFYVNATFNGTKMPSYFGDGVIVSTPTGSTAYSLAAGGPIVEPNVEVIVITPICPHSLHQRPMVLPATGLLQLSPSFKNKEDGAIVSFDGQLNLPLEPGAVLELSRAPRAIELLALPQRGFFDVLHKKLSWGKEEC